MLSMKRGNLDSIAVSLFADIFIELTNTVSDGKIQITILILTTVPTSGSSFRHYIVGKGNDAQADKNLILPKQ